MAVTLPVMARHSFHVEMDMFSNDGESLCRMTHADIRHYIFSKRGIHVIAKAKYATVFPCDDITWTLRHVKLAMATLLFVQQFVSIKTTQNINIPSHGHWSGHIDEQNRPNSVANTLELSLSCTNPSIFPSGNRPLPEPVLTKICRHMVWRGHNELRAVWIRGRYYVPVCDQWDQTLLLSNGSA